MKEKVECTYTYTQRETRESSAQVMIQSAASILQTCSLLQGVPGTAQPRLLLRRTVRGVGPQADLTPTVRRNGVRRSARCMSVISIGTRVPRFLSPVVPECLGYGTLVRTLPLRPGVRRPASCLLSACKRCRSDLETTVRRSPTVSSVLGLGFTWRRVCVLR